LSTIKIYQSNPISQLLSAGRGWQKLAAGISSFKQDFFFSLGRQQTKMKQMKIRGSNVIKLFTFVTAILAK
jgi:hypothetical protein